MTILVRKLGPYWALVVDKVTVTGNIVINITHGLHLWASLSAFFVEVIHIVGLLMFFPMGGPWCRNLCGNTESFFILIVTR